MPAFIDHLGREVLLPHTPMRIVSLCPSQTETLFHFGIGDRVVGRTRFCIHPAPAVQEVQAVGGTKEVHLDRIRQLEPDLIICEKEENTPEMVAALAEEFPVYVTNVEDYGSALRMIRDLGTVCGLPQAGLDLAKEIDLAWQRLPASEATQPCLYFIWRKPFMVAGRETFISDVIARMGWENLALDWPGRYPEVSAEQIRQSGARLILLSSEPYPFGDKHIAEIQALLPHAEIRLVDGEMFTWYGSRMLQAPAYLREVLHDH